MKMEDFWAALIVKRSTLADPEAKIEFIVKNLKLLLQQAWDQGYKHGGGVAKQMQSLLNAFERDKEKSDIGIMMERAMRSKDPMKEFMKMMSRNKF